MCLGWNPMFVQWICCPTESCTLCLTLSAHRQAVPFLLFFSMVMQARWTCGQTDFQLREHRMFRFAAARLVPLRSLAQGPKVRVFAPSRCCHVLPRLKPSLGLGPQRFECLHTWCRASESRASRSFLRKSASPNGGMTCFL